MRRLIVVLVVLAAAVRTAPAFAESFVAGDENHMFSAINSTRASHGRSTLVRSAALDKIARDQSAKMAKQHKLSHNLNIGGALSALGVHASWTGENTVFSKNIDSAMRDFLASPHHLDNILRSNYTAVGIGVLKADDGYVWVTQDFAQIGRAAAAAPIPRRTAPPVVRTAPPATAKPTAPPTPKPKPTPEPARVEPNAIQHGIVVPHPIVTAVPV